jgi:hypothetical protein
LEGTLPKAPRLRSTSASRLVVWLNFFHSLGVMQMRFAISVPTVGRLLQRRLSFAGAGASICSAEALVATSKMAALLASNLATIELSLPGECCTASISVKLSG